MRVFFFRTWVVLAGLSLGFFPPVRAQTPVPDTSSTQPKINLITGMTKSFLQEAYQLMHAQNWAGALEKIDAALKLDPQNMIAYSMRATAHIKLKQWDEARKDLENAHRIQPDNIFIKFNLAELQFQQGQYAAARASFLPLVSDPKIGDVVAYRMFLCDLCGKKEDAAARELEIFKQRPQNPSYQYANAAWNLFHHKTAEARAFLDSAETLYSPQVAQAYLSSLNDLGYLPLPPVVVPAPTANDPAAK